jgi:hypothetical protein
VFGRNGAMNYGGLKLAATKTSGRVEWIEWPHAESFKVPDIPGHNNEIVDDCRCSDHCILDEVIRPAVQEAPSNERLERP